MQKRFTVCALTMLSITCGAALAAQLTPSQKIDRVTTILKSLETRDLRPLAYIGSSYTQHNLQVADGQASIRELVLHPPADLPVRTVRIFADGDYVAAQNDYNFGGPKVGFDVFRFDGDNIVEHWDNLQDKCAAPNPSGGAPARWPDEVTDLDKTDANKLLMKRYFDDVVLGSQRDKIAQYRSADNFHQHNCDGEDNKSGFQTKTGIFAKPGFVFKYTKVYKILGQGNFVLVISEGLFDAKPTAFYDLYRIENGRQVRVGCPGNNPAVESMEKPERQILGCSNEHNRYKSKMSRPKLKPLCVRVPQIVASALLVIGLGAYAQQSSDKPVISLSTVSKLDRSQAGIYRTKVGKIDLDCRFGWNRRSRTDQGIDSKRQAGRG